MPLLLITSCNDDSDDDFPNGTGIKGKINVQNEFQQPLYDERDGIQVILQVGFQEFSIDADNAGGYIFSSVPTGWYRASFSKPGYSTVTISGIQVSTVNPELPIEDGYQRFPTVTLTKLPVVDVTEFMLDLSYSTVGTEPNVDTLYNLDVSGVLVPSPPPTGHAKGFRVFVGVEDGASPSNYIHQEHFTTTSASFMINFEDEWFNENNVSGGDVIYVAVYGDANYDMSYEDAEGELIFPNISSEVGALSSVALP